MLYAKGADRSLCFSVIILIGNLKVFISYGLCRPLRQWKRKKGEETRHIRRSFRLSDSDECKQAHLDTDPVQLGRSISQLTTSMPRLAEYNAKSPCLENRCSTSRLTCTGASSIYQAARASRACSRDICYVQYFNLFWKFFITKKSLLERKRICTYEKSSSSTKTPIWLPIIFVAEIWPMKRDVTWKSSLRLQQIRCVQTTNLSWLS